MWFPSIKIKLNKFTVLMLTGNSPMLPIQQCRFQNMAREYCKIFSAEARVIENFGLLLEWVESVWNIPVILRVIRVTSVSVPQGDSCLPDVPAGQHCALCYSWGWSGGSLSEILCTGSHGQAGHEDWLWGGTEVLHIATLDFSVDQWQSAAHSAGR